MMSPGATKRRNVPAVQNSQIGLGIMAPSLQGDNHEEVLFIARSACAGVGNSSCVRNAALNNKTPHEHRCARQAYQKSWRSYYPDNGFAVKHPS